MLTRRLASQRGFADHGWLKTYHTFSFAGYHDPAHVRFRTLRVMNEDWVAPGMGFGMHGHQDMEILTYVLQGALEHKDSLGNGAILRPGEFQRMTAGAGIQHSEFNPSTSAPVHLYQIWIFPNENGLTPSYEQRPFDDVGQLGKLQLVASPAGESGSLTIHQDARVYRVKLTADQSVTHALTPGRKVWLQALTGSLLVNGQPLAAGDGAALTEEHQLEVSTKKEGEALVFDLG